MEARYASVEGGATDQADLSPSEGGQSRMLTTRRPAAGDISLGDIQNMPTFWVLALFGNFYNFCFHVQTCRHLGGYVYTF